MNGQLKLEISNECAASQAMSELQIVKFFLFYSKMIWKDAQMQFSSKCFSFAQLRFFVCAVCVSEAI